MLIGFRYFNDFYCFFASFFGFARMLNFWCFFLHPIVVTVFVAFYVFVVFRASFWVSFLCQFHNGDSYKKNTKFVFFL